MIDGPLLMMVTPVYPGVGEVVAQTVAGGVNMIQLRDHAATAQALREVAAGLVEAVGAEAAVVENVGVVEGDGVAGLHLPERALGSVRVAKEAVGEAGLIGVSVHSVAAAVRAQAEGADYMVAGTIFASASHPEREPAGLEYLRQVCAAVSIPVLAIGGITPENAVDCMWAGARGVAVLSPLRQAHNPGAVARAYRKAMEYAGGK